MQKTIQVFRESEIRIIEKNDRIFFSAYDIATALKLENKRKDVNHAIILGNGEMFEHEKVLYISNEYVVNLIWMANATLAQELMIWLLEFQNGHRLSTLNESHGITRDYFATTQVAKKFGLSAIALNEILRKEGIQYKVNDQWVVYAEYQDKGYTRTVKISKHGKVDEFAYHTYWTPTGVQFVEGLLLTLGYGEQLSMFQNK